jgi:O-antigen/teichoic acid export membrane protein
MKKSIAFGVFILFSVFASFLNYLTYPILSRLLQSSDFVDATVALSLLSQMSMFLSSIVALTVGLTKEGSGNSAKKLVEQLQQELLVIFLVLIAIFLSTSYFIFQPIQLSPLFAVPISIMLLLSIPISIYSGYMNGKGKLVKLASIALIAASLQLFVAVFAATITKSSLISLLGMALGQILALGLIVIVFKSEEMPRISLRFKDKLINQTNHMRELIKYTLFASFGVLIINLLQISDLLIFKRRPDDIVMFTDVYIISRVVFFAGIIFIWPLLSKIDIKKKRNNIKPIALFGSLVTLIGGAAIGVIVVSGEYITKILFNNTYDQTILFQISSLAIIFKCMFLILTALTLYSIVIRSYLAFWVPSIIALAIIVVAFLDRPDIPQITVLMVLNIIALGGSILFIVGLILENQTHKPIKI